MLGRVAYMIYVFVSLCCGWVARVSYVSYVGKLM